MKKLLSGDLSIIYDEPLFSPSTIWYPGLNLRNTIVVKNLSKSTRSLGIKAINTSQIGKLSEVLIFKIDEEGKYVFGGKEDKTLKDFLISNNELTITYLNPNETKTIGLTIYAPKTLTNEYQNKEVKINITIGFLNSSSTPEVLGEKTALLGKNIFIYSIIFIALIFIIIFRKKLLRK